MTTINQVFTEAQRELLAAMLNRIIPAEVGAPGRAPLPGAGDLGVVDFLEGVLRRDLRLRRLFLQGLAQVEITASRREAKGFVELPDAARDATLRQVEAEHPRFFEALVRQTYSGYYTHPRVFECIGYDVHRVYQTKPFDESLLEQQRQRAPFWRRAL